MTPEEKAKEIYDKMKGFRVTNKHRKKCALVAVDEVLRNANEMSLSLMDYYNEVRIELESL